MNTTEKYLEKIQQEFLDPVSLGVASVVVASVIIIKELIMFFLFVSGMSSTTKIDSSLSKELNDVTRPLGVKKDFKVHVVPSKVPNAFTPGGKHVYITSGLMKLLGPREVMAVLLHEVYHAIDKHVWKRMAAEFPMYYIAVPIALIAAVASGPLAPITGLLVFGIMLAVLRIPIKVMIGRGQEMRSDNYAVKAGYGKDIAGALSKIEQMLKKMEAGKACGKICKVINRIEEKMDEHPPLRDRIETALKDTELMKALDKGKLSAITYKVKQLFGKGD
jgi:Zn-dependent protease with chaperone function